MNIAERADRYSKIFPDRPPLIAFSTAGQTWITGTWLIGSCYANPNPLYGAYPHGYLDRVHAMFPDARNVLHAFSGGLTTQLACSAAWGSNEPPEGCSMALVDLHGPDQGRHPTWQGSIEDFCEIPENQKRFDLVLVDPPYSEADAQKYSTSMINRRKITHCLREITSLHGNMIWLDQVWPMFRKSEWNCWGQIGLVRSTNHRVRLVTCFQAI